MSRFVRHAARTAGLVAAAAPLSLGFAGHAATGVTAAPDAPAASVGTKVVDARTLPTGAKPAVDYLVGRQINPRGKRGFTADLPPLKTGTTKLLGYGTRGFVVQRQGYFGSLYNVRGNGSVTRFSHVNMGGEAWSARLNRAGDTVASLSYDRADSTGVDLTRTDGSTVGGRTFAGYPWMVESYADGILFGRSDSTTRWTVGSGVTKVAGAGADYADARTGTLFVRTGDDTSGPTRLNAPGAARWSARFAATAVSADGKRVAGIDPTQRRVIEVRTMDTGEVLARYRSATGVGQTTMAFEPSGDLVWEAVTSKGRTMVRSRVDGTLKRATPFRAHDFSVAREREVASGLLS